MEGFDDKRFIPSFKKDTELVFRLPSKNVLKIIIYVQ